MIPMDEVEIACAELARAARLGLKGGMIWGSPPAGRRYDRPEWDRVWASAADLGLPLSLHVITEEERSGVPASTLKEYPSMYFAPARSITDIIFGGALARFPKLNIVLAENDVGWIAHYLQRMDHSYEKYRFLEEGNIIPQPPSFYFRRQIHCTFQDDAIGVLTRHAIGIDNLMWASDYPHSDSTWPNSRETVAREFRDVPHIEMRKIVHDNCARLYGFAA
jgi:predicted TIM-barrel fold metal-dependent hydrolase